MRWLVWVVAVAGLVWGGVWFALSGAVRRGAEMVIDRMEDAGRLSERPGVSVSGFPNRVDLTLTGLRLTDAASGVAWQAPFLQMFMMTWKPWHVIAAFPPEQRLHLPDGALDLAASGLQASLKLRPVAALPLDRLVVAGDGLRLTRHRVDADPATLTVETLRFGTRPDPSRPDTHEIGLDVAGILPDPAVIAALPIARRLPPRIDRLRVGAYAGFSAPLDRFAGENRPALVALDLREARFDWGSIRLMAEGRLTPDDQGRAEGRIAISLADWPAALDAAVAAGLIRPEIAPTWAEFARRLAETSADPTQLDLPLSFEGGRVSLGPIPLGRAPQFVAGPQG